MNRDASLSIYRVLATLFVLLCHIGTHYGSALVAMGFLVGVEMFLLLSGYLCAAGAHKRRDLRYFASRYLRLLLPVWILLAFYIPPALLSGHNTLADFLPYLAGVVGLPRLHGGAYFTQVQGLTHLWYITAALLCEVAALPLLFVWRRLTKKNCARRVAALGALVPLCLFGGATPLRLGYLWAFAAGVFLYDLPACRTERRALFCCGAALVGAAAVRLLGMRYLDDTHLYTNGVIPLSYLVIAAALFVLVRTLARGRMQAFLERLSKERVFVFLEKHSYEIYLVHYVFIVGPLCVFDLRAPEWVKLLGFLLCSATAAALLRLLVRAVRGGAGR